MLVIWLTVFFYLVVFGIDCVVSGTVIHLLTEHGLVTCVLRWCK